VVDVVGLKLIEGVLEGETLGLSVGVGDDVKEGLIDGVEVGE
jgi:hypothetical protein